MKFTPLLLIIVSLCYLSFVPVETKTLHGKYCKTGKMDCESSISFETNTTGILFDMEKGNLWPFRYYLIKGKQVFLYHQLDSTLIDKFKLTDNDSLLVSKKVTYRK